MFGVMRAVRQKRNNSIIHWRVLTATCYTYSRAHIIARSTDSAYENLAGVKRVNEDTFSFSEEYPFNQEGAYVSWLDVRIVAVELHDYPPSNCIGGVLIEEKEGICYSLITLDENILKQQAQEHSNTQFEGERVLKRTLADGKERYEIPTKNGVHYLSIKYIGL